MKLGIIGSGKIVQEFLSISSQLKNIELEAILGRKSSTEKLQALQAQYHIGQVYYDYTTLLDSSVEVLYIALPNHLHYAYAKRALQAGKHVIVEKPFTMSYEQAKILAELSIERNVFLFEAITTIHSKAFRDIRNQIENLGDIKAVHCNFSQYSSRYEAFKQGEKFPVFDPNCGGGALLDINVYNIHYCVGLFGNPRTVTYYPNMEKGVDTSGILMLDYENFKCVCTGAKDSQMFHYSIQGNEACLSHDTPANQIGTVSIVKYGKKTEAIQSEKPQHRMIEEFEIFFKIIADNDKASCVRLLNHTLNVTKALDEAQKFIHLDEALYSLEDI